MSNDRLAEALRTIAEWNPPPMNDRDGNESSMALEIGSNGVRDYFRGIARNALQAHAAEAAQAYETMTPRELANRIGRGEKWQPVEEPAQAQAQSGEWTPDLPQAYAVFWKAYQLANDCGHPQTSCYENGAMAVVYWAKKAMLAAAPQRAAEPVGEAPLCPLCDWGVFVGGKCSECNATAEDLIIALRMKRAQPHPQPAQDAKDAEDAGVALDRALALSDAKDAARYRWLRQFLSLEDVGDEEMVYALVIDNEGLEDKASRARCWGCAEFHEIAPSVDDAIDEAIVAMAKESGR